MKDSSRKPLLTLPLKVILTEVGASHFIRKKKKLLRIKLADNVEEYGISLESFSPQTIQQMLLVNYISKLEISMAEFTSSRQDVVDLSKLVVYSFLYKGFNKDVHTALVDSSCILRYNRMNPSQVIDGKAEIPDKQLVAFLTGRQEALGKVREIILTPLWEEFKENGSLSPEEKNTFMLMTEKFLDRMSRRNWYIIMKFFDDEEGFGEFVERIHEVMRTYVEKSHIAEYIAIMVMELAVNSENANMRRQARLMYPDYPNVSEVICNPDTRRSLVEEMERRHELVFLSWKLGGGSLSIGKQGRLQITLYNKNDEFHEVKSSIEATKTADLNKQSLIDFYRELPQDAEGVELGVHYLSYLDEACKKMNIKFGSLVNQYSASGLLVITLTFDF